MPILANDRLDPDRTHGDLLLTIEAEHVDTLQHALRQVLRRTREHLVLHWLLEGYTRGSAPGDGSAGAPRNLMGFKDGTANLDPGDAALMDELVWVGAGDPEPAWAAGGTYQAVRVIRMLVEFWDRTPLAEQEAIFGRVKATGAPLGGTSETDPVDFAGDPDGAVIPLDAHIRLANPRTPATQSSRILRRGLSYTRGFDAAGQLDQGLAFVSYQRSLERGFLAVQARLSGEALEEYTLPEGGGFYFVLPGVADEAGFLGQQLLDA
jgi:deferrochelatase/peroxidase EfeB